MGRNSAISWTDHTFNPWWGCEHVAGDPQCDNCYAEVWAKRCGVAWGGSSARRMFADKHWNEPVVWNEMCGKQGLRERVFCGSMCDLFEDKASLDEPRQKVWDLVERCTHLDWLLLTKRPENVAGKVPTPWMSGKWPSNAWLGTSVGTQAIALARGRILLGLPAPVRFISAEPMLGPLSLRSGTEDQWNLNAHPDVIPFDWVIMGGESGPHARPLHAEWIASLIVEVGEHNFWAKVDGKASTVAAFVKQLGTTVIAHGEMAEHFMRLGWERTGIVAPKSKGGLLFRHPSKAGRDPQWWPEFMRLSQVPQGPRREDA